MMPPNPIYPARSRTAGEQGTVMIRVLVDVDRPAGAGRAADRRPAIRRSTKSALSAVRAAQFRPYAEGGVAQAVWVLFRSILCCSSRGDVMGDTSALGFGHFLANADIVAQGAAGRAGADVGDLLVPDRLQGHQPR